MNFNFGEVLTRAWQIIWKHKVLWIFGILASCGRGGSGGSSGGGGESGFQTEGPDLNLPPQAFRLFQTIEDNLTTFIVIAVAVVCIIWIVTIFLSTIGKIGLIRGTVQTDDGAEKLIFGQLFSESIPYFWRMFWLSLILSLPVLIVGITIAIAAVFFIIQMAGSSSLEVSMLGLIPLTIGCICLLVPIMFVLGLIFRQAERAIVLEELGVLPAISRGWEVFKGNLGPIILMAIILAVIGIVVGFVVAIPFLFLVLPALFGVFLAGETQSFAPLIIPIVCFCLFIPVALILQGIITAYSESAWTLTYLRLTKPQDNAPILSEANA